MGNIGYVVAERPVQALAEFAPPLITPEMMHEDERLLWNVFDLWRNRQPDGTYDAQVRADSLKNLIAETHESSMSNAAITTTRLEVVHYEDEHKRRRRTCMFLGKTAIEVAEGGALVTDHPAVLDRVKVEVDEAHQTQDQMRPGFARILVSPHLTKKDAARGNTTKEVEDLTEKDALRMTVPVTNEQGEITARDMSSLLVGDVPLEAWIKMFADPRNIFGKSIIIEDNGSALPVMQTHRVLEIPVEDLTEGLITVLVGVVPYIVDKDLQEKVMDHIQEFRMADQKVLKKYGMNIAQRQQEFDLELVESLRSQRTSAPLEQFIKGMWSKWGDDVKTLIILNTLPDGGIHMDTHLAARLTKAQQTLLSTRAGVLSGNQEILDQMSIAAQQLVSEQEHTMQDAQNRGANLQHLAARDMAANRTIAQHNVQVGAGCSSRISNGFGSNNSDGSFGSESEPNLEDFQRDETEVTTTEEDESAPSMIRCVIPQCRRKFPKEKVVQPDRWCCPACNYAIDICTGDVIVLSKYDSKGKGDNSQADGGLAALFGVKIVALDSKTPEKSKKREERAAKTQYDLTA